DDRLASGTTCSVVGTSILLADDVHTDISDDAVNRYASVGIDWFDWSQFDAGATWRRRSCRATRTSPLCTGADFWYRGSCRGGIWIRCHSECFVIVCHAAGWRLFFSLGHIGVLTNCFG